MNGYCPVLCVDFGWQAVLPLEAVNLHLLPSANPIGAAALLYSVASAW